ncbi:MAG TPA: zf-HC2 domain-containing protein [Euzebyales bacterium]|nr:zf-HC2 domain-containing protein [Euzebyales bacterium]
MGVTVDLSCTQQVALVTAYLDDVLPTQTRARFEAHLGSCDSCQAHLQQARQTLAVTGAMSADDLDEAMMDRLMVTFRDWRAAPSDAER